MNVIVLVNDSLRVDQIGCYQPTAPTPLGTRIETTDIDRRYKPRGDDSDTSWRPKNAQYLRNMASRQREDDYTLAQAVTHGLDWLERQVSRGRNDGLFLWLDCFDPHEPWDAPEEIT